jgi:hypothetical protein
MSDFSQVEIYSNGSTHTLYETCGHSNCNEKILQALGVGDERYKDQDEFYVGDVKISVMPFSEPSSCVWCFGCGDFLQHGTDDGGCECEERGYDPEEDREPMEPMVDVNGMLELRPFR